MNKNLALFIFFLLLLLGLRFFFFYHNQPQYHDGDKLDFHTTLLSEPQIVGNRQLLSANLSTGNKIFITIPQYPQFHYGDTVRISGPIRVLPRAGGFQPRAREGQPYGASTQKDKALDNKNLILAMYFPKIEAGSPRGEAGKSDNLISNNIINSVLATVSFIRQKVIYLFEKSLPPTSASLLLGIVFGIKEAMPKDFSQNLRVAGVLHVIAASGMNVTLIGSFLSSVFAFFFKRQIALVASIVGIVFYALLAGLEASIIRASIMGVLVFSAQILGRQSLALYGLSIAGFLMLFISPYLLHDVGFQLSFASTLGLLYIKPLIEKEKIKAVLEKSIIGEGLTTTIAAQIATLPILLANFGSYSLISILVNGLVLWTVPALMVIGGLGAIIGIVVAPLGQLILYLSLPLLIYFEKVVNFFAYFINPVSVASLPWQFILGYYTLIGSFLILFKKKNR